MIGTPYPVPESGNTDLPTRTLPLSVQVSVNPWDDLKISLMILICVPDGRSLTLALLFQCSWFNHPITRLPAIAIPWPPAPILCWLCGTFLLPRDAVGISGSPVAIDVRIHAHTHVFAVSGVHHHRVLNLNHASKSVHTISHTRSELVRVSCLFPVTVRAWVPSAV